MPINIISDAEGSNFHCKMCVSVKLFLFDKANNLYKCGQCGSLYKYSGTACKPKLGVDKELDNLNETKIMFYQEKKEKKNEWPELGNMNYQILSESEIDHSSS
jgi:hypothetical protein